MSEKKLSILAVGAHIGDAEITAGLLVTKYAAAGHRATILHMTAGEKGNPRMDHREYRRQRVTEAQAAAAELVGTRWRAAQQFRVQKRHKSRACGCCVCGASFAHGRNHPTDRR